MYFKGKQKQIVLLLLAIALCAVVGNYYLHTRDKELVIPEAEAITYSTDTPEETKPDSGYNWRGEPIDPKYIRLPSIGAEGFIQRVGVDQNQQVAVPNNVHVGGWFVDSVRPGQTGLSIIDGHVDGREADGIFKNLANLKENDEYSIEMGDGNTTRYRVIEVASVDTSGAANVLFSQKPNVKSQLNLITCGGDFDPSARSYNKRVIVSSELIE